MALTNAQYDSLMREYNNKQMRNHQIVIQREEELYRAVPELSRLDDDVSRLSVESIDRLLNGDAAGSAALKEKLGDIRKQRETLIQEHGYPLDYLTPPYDCPLCQDTGFVDGKRCRCFVQASIDLVYSQSHLDDILDQENFDVFSFDYYSKDIVDAKSGRSSLDFAKDAYETAQNFVQNFSTDEAAILELVKNAYDANALNLKITFQNDTLRFEDNGIGMNADDIKKHWMHIGKSSKEYEIIDENNKKRIQAGSKGVGRFALSRLGYRVCLKSKKIDSVGVIWKTDWNTSVLDESYDIHTKGTDIEIIGLREKWNKKRIENLNKYLERTYHDTSMEIRIISDNYDEIVVEHFPKAEVGINCRSNIVLKYNQGILVTSVESDEFENEALKYCPGIDIKKYETKTDIVNELKGNKITELLDADIQTVVNDIGEFSANLYFNISTSKELPCSDIAVCTILSNALENAMHALEQMNIVSKRARLIVSQKKEHLLIQLENPVEKIPEFVDGVPVSNRDGHGIGVKSIIYYVEQLHGQCHFSVSEHCFVLRIII